MARSRPSAFGGLEVDDKLELGRLHDRQVGRFSAFENAANIDANLTLRVQVARPIADQSSDIDVEAPRIDRGDGVAGRQLRQLHTPHWSRAGRGR